MKGKIIKYCYSDENYESQKHILGVEFPLGQSSDREQNKNIAKNLMKAWNIYKENYMPTIYTEVIEWEEIFYNKDSLFRLNSGERFNLNGIEYRIVSVSGTDTNKIIYYIDHIVRIENDHKSREKIKENVQKEIDKTINEIYNEWIIWN